MDSFKREHSPNNVAGCPNIEHRGSMVSRISQINYITFQNEPEYHMYMSEHSLLSSEEKTFLERNNISTSNISESIYYDDTIDTIKRKIMLSITKASFGEL